MNFDVLAHEGLAADEAPFEAVERKGRGHPDTICDLVAEHVSRDLQQFYLRECGRVLHYNVDKALLVGGQSGPRFGGGAILQPAKLYLGDRAIFALDGKHFDLKGLIEGSIANWLNANLRFLRLNENLEFISEIREGAAALNAVEDRNVANDTSVGVGFWPLSPLEQMTLAVEEYMNARAFKERHPLAGEDIKVMAVRRGKTVEIVIACALIARFVANMQDYRAKTQALLSDVTTFVNSGFGSERHISVRLNALDDPSRGEDGLYLTVTGLSCESGDSGQVGRGNRVNGLISFLRPQTMEAWAGKNAKSHVGKIYSFGAQSLARRLTEEVPEIKEATVVLVGRIGSAVDRPADVFADVKLWGHCHGAIEHKVTNVLDQAIREGAVFRPENLFIAAPVAPPSFQSNASSSTERTLRHDARTSA